ncbi:MAG: YgiQ family radical SAM protein, partial [Oscillospiraceae bacterium]
ARLASGTPISEITDVRGTAFIAPNAAPCIYPMVECASFETVCENKREYAVANKLQYDEHDPFRGKAVLQRHGDQMLIVNPPAMPLTTEELDRVAELPYVREPHPMYDDMGGVPSIEEVRFSVIHNRGCFGACNFCSLAFHQGRVISSRSHESVIREVTALTKHPGFKGYIHDVGGPTANLRRPSCQKQLKAGLCKNRACLAPTPCPNLDADHSDYLKLLRELREIPKVKKIFIRSGIRFDYMLQDKDKTFFKELVEHHVSGQLKVAPEHCVDSVLDYMGKPHIDVYEKFAQQYEKYNEKCGKEQYLVPYLMSSHPGCTINDAVNLAEWLKKSGRQPEQVQDFYPTPGTLSTCMYYTGIDPRTMREVFVPKTPEEKAMQRALMQWKRPEKRALVLSALHAAHREDLIGYEPTCLVRPNQPRKGEGYGYGKGKPTTEGDAHSEKPAGGRGGRGPATAHRGKPKPGSFGQNPYGAPYQGKGKPAGKSAGKPATGGKPAPKSAAPTEQPKKIKRKAGWAKPAKKAEGLRGP